MSSKLGKKQGVKKGVAPPAADPVATTSAPAPVVPKTYASLLNRTRGITTEERKRMNDGAAAAKAAAKATKDLADKAAADKKAAAEREATAAEKQAGIDQTFSNAVISSDKPFSKSDAAALIKMLDGVADINVYDILLRRLVDGLNVDLVSAFLAKLTALDVDINRVLLSNLRVYINSGKSFEDEKIASATSAEAKKVARDSLAKLTKIDELFIKYRDTTYNIGVAKWIRRVDPSNGASYYFNPDTKESKWELDEDEDEDDMPGLDYPTLESWLREAKKTGVLLRASEYPFSAKALSSLSGTAVPSVTGSPLTTGSPVTGSPVTETNTGSALSAIRAAAKASKAGVPNVTGAEESKARHSEIANAAKASVNASEAAAAALAKAKALTGRFNPENVPTPPPNTPNTPDEPVSQRSRPPSKFGAQSNPPPIRAPRNIVVAPESPGGGKRRTRKNKSKKNKSRKNKL